MDVKQKWMWCCVGCRGSRLNRTQQEQQQQQRAMTTSTSTGIAFDEREIKQTRTKKKLERKSRQRKGRCSEGCWNDWVSLWHCEISSSSLICGNWYFVHTQKPSNSPIRIRSKPKIVCNICVLGDGCIVHETWWTVPGPSPINTIQTNNSTTFVHSYRRASSQCVIAVKVIQMFSAFHFIMQSGFLVCFHSRYGTHGSFVHFTFSAHTGSSEKPNAYFRSFWNGQFQQKNDRWITL